MGHTQLSGALPLVDPELGIWFDGRSYHYQQYRYDRLADATAYAQADQRRPGYRALPLPQSWEQWLEPTSDELKIMAAFGIVFARGTYRYGPFQYDFLEQALAYARHTLASPAAQSCRPPP
jgi:hypothetical protein